MALPFSRQDCSLALKTGSTRMIKKQKDRQSNPPSKQDPRALCILQKPTESPADALAHTVTRPTVQAATTLMNYNKDFGEIAINTLVNDLETECKLANNGDLARRWHRLRHWILYSTTSRVARH